MDPEELERLRAEVREWQRIAEELEAKVEMCGKIEDLFDDADL